MDEDGANEAAERLRELETAGTTLDEVLSGEVGRRWIREDCGGDVEVAVEAFRRVHPEVRFVSFEE